MEDLDTTLTNPRAEKRQYLVTYSQADLKKFPSRQSFGEMVAHEFNQGKSVVRVMHWACCQEPHREHGVHYHCAVKLNGKKRWLGVKNSIQSKYGIVVNFSDSHNFYMSAYKYINKNDREVYHSAGHPDLSSVESSPPTSKCIRANRAKAKSKAAKALDMVVPIKPGESAQLSRKRTLSPSDVGDFIVRKKIKTKLELYTEANKRKAEGQKSLSDFIMVTRDTTLDEIIHKAWFMNDAPKELIQNLTPRMQVIRDAANQPCEDNGCEWYDRALELLDWNGIDHQEYALAMRTLLIEGRGKRRNLMFLGPSDCAKTHLLKPLKKLFDGRIFDNPSSGGKFSWVEAENKDIILLNDFRWEKELIPWKDLLLLLEGEPTRLPAPKNFRLKDILIDTDVPIFATAGDKIEYRGAYNTMNKMENTMMDNRWRFFQFTYIIPEARQIKIKPCGQCFSRLVLLGE